MSSPSLPSDDLPSEITEQDRTLRRQLDESLTDRFRQQFDLYTRLLLQRCDWYITTYGNGVTLVIHCPDANKNWQVLHHVLGLALQLEKFSKQAKIRIYPPIGEGAPFEMRIDERSIYQDFS